MKFSNNTTEKNVRRALASAARGLELEELVGWKSTSWSHLLAITAGLKPFSDSAVLIIPEIYRPHIPSVDFIPTDKDRKVAAQALRNAIHHVNYAIVETTKAAYGSVFESALGPLLAGLQNSIPGGIEQFIDDLTDELNNYEMRKLYFQTGLAMMTDEQAWLGKLQTFGVGVLGIYDADPTRVLTAEEYFSFAYDLGMLEDEKITFDPLNQNKQVMSPDQMMSAFTQTLNQAYDSGTS